MKKYILTLVISTTQMIAIAQTINIHFKNGQTIEYPSANVDYVDFSTKASDPNITAGQAVDLGLSVCWALCNIGAEKPEESGNYYAWGETSPKSIYTVNNYSFYDINTTIMVDIGSDISGTEYDAATVNLGSNWRTPTKTEMEELMNQCEWKWSQIHNMNGYVVTGKNGNSIFLPAVSLADQNGPLNKSELYYGTSTLEFGSVCCLEGYSSKIRLSIAARILGLTIRPVTSNPNAVDNLGSSSN